MQELFPGYYALPDAVVNEMWDKTALFVIDANILLHVFRYPPAARDSLLELLERLGTRVWLPHQAAHEYHRNVDKVIREHEGHYATIASIIDSAVATIETKLAAQRPRAAVNTDELIAHFTAARAESHEQIEAARKRHPSKRQFDQLKERLANLFDNKVGPPFVAAQLVELYKEAEHRVAAHMPPGFKDSQKGPPDCFGDFVIWRQIVDKATSEQRPIIFATDDGKVDWWWKDDAGTRRPRNELVCELKDAAGATFLMVDAAAFMDRGRAAAKLRKRPAAVAQARRAASSGDTLALLTRGMAGADQLVALSRHLEEQRRAVANLISASTSIGSLNEAGAAARALLETDAAGRFLAASSTLQIDELVRRLQVPDLTAGLNLAPGYSGSGPGFHVDDPQTRGEFTDG